MKGLKKIFHESANQKRTGVTILISDKIDVKPNTGLGDKDEHYIMIKTSIHH